MKHWQAVHRDKDDPPGFNYKVIGTHKSAIGRQITEAIWIENTSNEFLMNGKGEWGQNHVPRMKLTLPEYQQNSANLPNSKNPESNVPATAKRRNL